jgi:cytochrome oxidase Cu insertion factor (SCO1/SenC/PrrC family)
MVAQHHQGNPMNTPHHLHHYVGPQDKWNKQNQSKEKKREKKKIVIKGMRIYNKKEFDKLTDHSSLISLLDNVYEI